MAKDAGNRLKRQRGQTMVETALILPILLMLVLGAVDLGRVYYHASAVRNATRVGAQYAMDPLTSHTEIKEAVIAEASPYVIITMDRVVLTTDAWAPGHNLTVTLTYDFHPITPFARVLWGDPIVLSHSTTIRFE